MEHCYSRTFKLFQGRHTFPIPVGATTRTSAAVADDHFSAYMALWACKSTHRNMLPQRFPSASLYSSNDRTLHIDHRRDELITGRLNDPAHLVLEH